MNDEQNETGIKQAQARLELTRAINRWRDIDAYYQWMIDHLSQDRGTRKLTKPVFDAMCDDDRGWEIKFDRSSSHITVYIREPGTYRTSDIKYSMPIAITPDRKLWTIDRLICLLERARPTRQIDWLSQAYNMIIPLSVYQSRIDAAKAQMELCFQAMVNPWDPNEINWHSMEWKRWPDEILAHFPDAHPGK